MIPLSVQFTAVIVTLSMGLFFTVVSVLCVVPIYEALIEKRRPQLPNLPAASENLGIALAIGGLAFRETELAAVGLGLALLGWFLGTGRPVPALPRLVESGLMVSGLVCLSVIGKFHYFIG